MKNTVKLIGILVITALVGLGFWACEEPEPDPWKKLTGTVSIEGVAQVGQTLTANISTLGGSGETTFQWMIGGGYSPGVNVNNIYVIKASDVGETIVVQVSRINDSGKRVYKRSEPTDVVTAHTPGLEYRLINNNTAYSVSKGTAISTVIVIPSVHEGLPVAAIEDSGFTSYTKMTDIIIPNGVTRIGNYAFFNCSNLESVLIPAGVTNIGTFAFDGCGSLKTVYYGGASDSIWGSIAIGSSNMVLTNADKYYYTDIPISINTYWRFVDGIPKIWGFKEGLIFKLLWDGTGYSVSRGNATDEIILIPSLYEGKPVIEISNEGFRNYYNLTSIAIPDSVTSIGNNAFYGCTGLTSVTIGNSVTSIDGFAFSGCTSLTSITIPNSVTDIGYYAFSGCTGLTSITIPNSVTSISWNAFLSCTSLTSITIPDSVTSIGYGAFYYCTGLTSITIPDSVTSIGSDAFYNCTGLISIIVDSGNTIYRSEGNCLIERSSDTLIVGCKTSVIPNGVTSIGNRAFSGCAGLTSITIPDSVTSIGQEAFSGCTGLTSITIPDSVTSISYSAFYGCTGLTSITVPDSVTSIGEHAFRDCSGLTSITVPDSVTSIGNWAFYNCTSLTSVTFMGIITSNNLSSYAFGSSSYSGYLGDLRDKYLTGGVGTYTRADGSLVWVKQ